MFGDSYSSSQSKYLNLCTVVASLQITSAADSEAVTRQKLVKGHAYSLTGAVEVMSLRSRELR